MKLLHAIIFLDEARKQKINNKISKVGDILYQVNWHATVIQQRAIFPI